MTEQPLTPQRAAGVRVDAPTMWVDEAEVDPAWPAPMARVAPSPPPGSQPKDPGSDWDRTPADEPPRPTADTATTRRRLPPGFGYLVVVLALALIGVGIWAAGGFKHRGDLLRDVATGQLITSGPYEFRFTGVTAQQKTDFSTKKPYWELIVIGEGRTTGDVSIRPDYIESDTGMFVSKDPVSGEIVSPDSDRIGPADEARTDFTPGLPATPYTITFKYSGSYKPGPSLLFAVSDIVYGPHSLTDDQEEWHNATYGQRYDLPVRVLAPDLG